MRGLGTIVNAGAILVGGVAGLVCRRFLKERFQETVLKAMGFAILVMALGGALSQMLAVRADGRGLEVRGTMMMIVSVAGGALLGELLDLNGKFTRCGAWLRDHTGNRGDPRFIDGFVSASLTVCVGAMAILGAIQDGVTGSHDTLFAKSILDLVIVMMMTAALGKGCIFSAIPVAVFQGLITVLAGAIAPVLTDAAVGNLSLVGNVLILGVGVNLVWPQTIRVANVLPAVVLAVLFAYL